MEVNYILLLITGISSLMSIISLCRGNGFISRYMFGDVMFMIVFVGVLIATIMGIDYNTFKTMIETGDFSMVNCLLTLSRGWI